METATLALTVAFAIAFLVVTVAAIVELVGPRRLRARPTVLVVLKSGDTIRGALLSRRRSTVELGGAEVLGREANTPIDGTVFVDRANIAWIQRPGG